MDFEIPEEVNYLPKERIGFVPVHSGNRRPMKSNFANPTFVEDAPKSTTTETPSRTTPKATTLNRYGITSAKKTIPPRNTKDTTKSATNGTTRTRVVKVFPERGKMLSKIPEEKWKNVRPGPREDPNVVRTEAQEVEIFLKMTNDFRIKNKCSPLKFSKELSEIAREHNHDMMEGRTPVGHEGFSNRAAKVKGARGMSENCAMYVGPREHLQTLMENLINSKVHRENLLGNFNTIGITIEKNKENMWYVTQFFANFV
ncbi:hypothetical protein TRFO_40429 [Tritrichomonas foetus]|uniref:SCP domain-containing protein n=1 Tax=Tritrichomonas foetus TaxID=1144522 RepID=A0A1J4J529_9EUKA|nr:hypothetical protein TRFO_40429 [Tritrichomonas foetus]|eukprot:OHS93255.1 hypothetical protein TRFO_40429 [Tritrichomonas foetus]